MDLGCWAVNALRFALGAEPHVADASAVVGPPDVDVAMRASLNISGGIEGEISCSMVPETDGSMLEVIGSDATMRIQNPFLPMYGHRIELRSPSGSVIDELGFEAESTYYYQLQAFAAAVRGDETVLEVTSDAADAVANLTVIDRIYEAAGLQPRG